MSKIQAGDLINWDLIKNCVRVRVPIHSHEILDSSSSIDTIVSTASTLLYELDAEFNIEARSIPSTINLDYDDDSDHETPILLTHVNDNRPLAPYTVISETRVTNDEAITDKIATAHPRTPSPSEPVFN